jgi:hypothetical protein
MVKWARLLSQRPRYTKLLEGWTPTTMVNLDDPFFNETLPPTFDEAVEFTGFALDEFKRRTDRDGALLIILATHSMRHSIRANGDHLFGRLKQLAEIRGIPVVDQYDYIRKTGGDIAEANFRHDGHWTVKGHQWAAESLLAFIQAHPTVCSGLPGSHSAERIN